jgi:hypothetical protein
MENTNTSCNCYTLKYTAMRPSERLLNKFSVRLQREKSNVHVLLLCRNKRVVRGSDLPVIRQV